MHKKLTKAVALATRNRTPDFSSFSLSPTEAQTRCPDDAGPLQRYFFANRGRVAHKWLHYLPIYERLLGKYRGTPVRMLEIGVAKGGSLEMWRSYFGPQATIFGIDIKPSCAEVADPPNQVRIGSQADPQFLASVVAEMGPPDIILDDGSHVASHQRASLRALWPELSPGGLYIIEDLHTSYWLEFEGGYRRPGTGIEMIKALIDDLHGWYHCRGPKYLSQDEIGSIQVFDSIAVIEKVNRPRPAHVKTGG
jgi:hypothetical protein